MTTPARSPSSLFLGFGLPLVLLGVGLSVWFGRNPEGPQFSDFTLQSATGPVRLSDFEGKVVALNFGYASCPDICPMTLQNVGSAFKRLTPEERAKVAGLFISIDPERDTPGHLAEYTRFFDPLIVGVTGTPEQLAPIAADWGVGYRRVEQPDSKLGYVMDHGTLLYLVGPDGEMVTALPHGAPPDLLVGELRSILADPER